MPVQTRVDDYAQKWNWALEIDGFATFMFTTADRPKVEFEVVAIAPGGAHRDQKLPGRASFEDLSFEKGVLANNDPDFLDWMQECLRFAEGTGLVDQKYMKTIDLVEYNRANKEINRWRLFGAWPKSFDGGNLDGSASETISETLVICYQYFQRK